MHEKARETRTFPAAEPGLYARTAPLVLWTITSPSVTFGGVFVLVAAGCGSKRANPPGASNRYTYPARNYIRNEALLGVDPSKLGQDCYDDAYTKFADADGADYDKRLAWEVSCDRAMIYLGYETPL